MPDERIVTEAMLSAALAVKIPWKGGPDACVMNEGSYPVFGTNFLTAEQMRIVLEAALEAASQSSPQREGAQDREALIRRLRLGAEGEYGGADAKMLFAQAAGAIERLDFSPRREWFDGDGNRVVDPEADELFDLVRLLSHDVPCGTFDHAEKIIAAGYRRIPAAGAARVPPDRADIGHVCNIAARFDVEGRLSEHDRAALARVVAALGFTDAN